MRSLVDRGVIPSHDELQSTLGCSAVAVAGAGRTILRRM